nr:MAG TPA: hypothetical protein [Caudoviricetes sp.]
MFCLRCEREQARRGTVMHENGIRRPEGVIETES